MQILQFLSKLLPHRGGGGGGGPNNNNNRKNPSSPLDVAYRENKKLMNAYRARLARMQNKKNKAAMVSIWVSYGCQMGVTWVSHGCHTGV